MNGGPSYRDQAMQGLTCPVKELGLARMRSKGKPLAALSWARSASYLSPGLVHEIALSQGC